MEARQLAKEFPRRFPGVRLTASFAGAVKDLPDLGVTTRVGGFGGIKGLADYIAAHQVSLVIDATHPFAARMSNNAVQATATLGIPVLRLERPPWTPSQGDLWHPVPTMDAAASALPANARAFLAIGRKEIDAFRQREDIVGVARMIEAPALPLPQTWSLVLSRPPASLVEEIDLLKKHAISHVVTKNSGGTGAYGKIRAARDLALPVIVVERPELPDVPTAESVSAMLALLEPICGRLHGRC